LRGQLFLPILLISVGISLLPFGCGTCQLYAEPATITVPDDYSSIQAAINAANPGDTVYVRNGTYYERVEVNKTISLVGENKDATVVDGNGVVPYYPVLGISDVSNATIQDLTVQNGTYGLGLGNANCWKLRNVSSRNNQYNFYFAAYGDIQNLVEDIDESNTVEGKPIYFWINRTNGQILSDAGYVALVNCVNITVRGPTLTKNIEGMTLMNVKDCLVENITITETQVPLRTDGMNNTILQSNLIANNTLGVVLANCNHTSFTNNTVLNMQGQSGINLIGSFNTISGNMILNISYGFGCGLQIAGDSNLITANKVVNNSYGIKIAYSYNNNVSNNEIEGNFFSQLELFNSSFNTIQETE
jgi:parallel beta-helix repeat protein